jgi:hypothetical protein
MDVHAEGALDRVNSLIDSREVLTTLVVALVTGIVGTAVTAYRRRRRITWQVLYDERVNSGEFLDGPPSGVSDDWNVALKKRQIKRATLAVIKIRNAGTATVEEQKIRQFLYFEFPGREVQDVKVRGSVHHQFKQMETDPEYLEEKEKYPHKAILPRLDLNTGESFQAVVLLSQTDNTVKPPASMMGGKIVGFPDRPFHEIKRPRRRVWAAAIGGVLVLLLGAFAGVALANKALTPVAACADGHLTIEGSTAFAPIANQVATSFTQSCPGATFSVRADGSGTGFAELQKTPDPASIALSDGQQPQDGGFVRKALGVVYFDGYLPTRDNVLSQRYRFVASEYLYTAGHPAGLTASYIDYLTGDAMTLRLRDQAFIACSDLAGSGLGGACA